MQQTTFCPLTNKTITYDDCFDISMVVEHLAPEWTINDDVKPDDIDSCREACLSCEMHPR